jgi:hypothetical protein
MTILSTATRRITLSTFIVASAGIAHAAPSSDLFEYATLGGAVMSSNANTIHLMNPGLGSEYGVAARRIAIGGPGVKEHVSTLRMDWADPFGVEMPVNSSVSVALIADTNPDGIGQPQRASRVTLLKRGIVDGVNSYELGFDFGGLGSDFATMTIETASGSVILQPFDDGSFIQLFGLPPGEPVVRTVKLPPEGIDVDWQDDDDDGDNIFDVDTITVTQLPPLLTGFLLPDGAMFSESIVSISLSLEGPETELDGVYGFDYFGTGLPSFSVSVPTPGSLSLIVLAGTACIRRKRSES